jgi:hypothetical protein
MGDVFASVYNGVQMENSGLLKSWFATDCFTHPCRFEDVMSIVNSDPARSPPGNQEPATRIIIQF